MLHASHRAYVNAAGRGSERTAGSSLVSISGGQIANRQIDLLGERADYLTGALPHELTHVILRDRFGAAVPPAWADEGAAILADPEAKQGRHLRDLANSLVLNTSFTTGELLMTNDYPRSDRIGLFYAQSTSLAKFLIEQENPKRFVEFIEQATRQGYDAALREYYGIDGVSELDRMWRRQSRIATVSTKPSSGHAPSQVAEQRRP